VMTTHDYHLVCPEAGGSWFRWLSGRRGVIGLDHACSLRYLAKRRWDHRSWLHSFMKLAQHGWNYHWHRRQRVIDMLICPSRFVERMMQPLRLPTCWLPHPMASLGKAPPRS